MKYWLMIGLSGLLVGVSGSQVQVLWSVEDERAPDNSWLYIIPGLQVDQAGNVYAAGATRWTYREGDAFLIKYGSDGTRQRMLGWNGGYGDNNLPSADGAGSLWLDRQGQPRVSRRNVYSPGWSLSR